MARRAATLCLAALGLAAAAAPAAPAQQESARPARVVGRVLERASGKPIEAVYVRLVGRTETGRLTDGWGAFAFARVEAGVYQLQVEHLGYESRSDTITVAGGEVLSLEVRLELQPVELTPLVVTARRWSVSPRLWSFYDRVDTGLGEYITREDIERRQPARVAHMIDELPGVTIVPVGTSRYRIVLSRYARNSPSGQLGACFPIVFVDGMRHRGYETIDELVMPEDVEGIEVYKGLATLPAEFADPGAECGAIAIWTRRGLAPGEGTKWTIWKVVAIPVVFVLGFLVLR